MRGRETGSGIQGWPTRYNTHNTLRYTITIQMTVKHSSYASATTGYLTKDTRPEQNTRQIHSTQSTFPHSVDMDVTRVINLIEAQLHMKWQFWGLGPIGCIICVEGFIEGAVKIRLLRLNGLEVINSFKGTIVTDPINLGICGGWFNCWLRLDRKLTTTSVNVVVVEYRPSVHPSLLVYLAWANKRPTLGYCDDWTTEWVSFGFHNLDVAKQSLTY